MTRNSLAIICVLIALTCPARAYDPQLGPYATALTNCVESHVRANVTGHRLSAGDLLAAAEAGLHSAACARERTELLRHYDGVHGPGSGKIFVDGPYLADLPNALARRGLAAADPSPKVSTPPARDLCRRLEEFPQATAIAQEVSRILRARRAANVDDLLSLFKAMIRTRAAQTNMFLARDPGFAEYVAEIDGRFAEACFPAYRSALEDWSREKARASEAAAAAAEQARQREAVLRLPKNVLFRSYIRYLFLRRCHDDRAGYASVYITDPQLEMAREAISGIESAIVKQDIEIDKDAIWADASRYDRNGQTGYDACHQELENLLASFRAINPVASAPKKDF